MDISKVIPASRSYTDVLATGSRAAVDALARLGVRERQDMVENTSSALTGTPAMGVALIGSGLFAKREHLPAILSTPRLVLKAVYSRSLESAATLTAELAQNVDFYSDETASQGRGFDDLLSKTDIKAVIIALPIMVQPAFIRKALDAGKHVLSEKPIAPDSKSAREMIEWYASIKAERGCTWSIAENWRFLDSHVFAAAKRRDLGRLLGFRIRRDSMVKQGDASYETAWRKKPEYQGGFLLDGGVHVIAAARLILGEVNDFATVAAFTAQLQEHLPPLDTINATVMTKSGVSGTFITSYGTTFTGYGFAFACEGGVVTALPEKVVVEKEGVEVAREFLGEGRGVKQELMAWSSNIRSGDQDSRFTPAEALKDLLVVSSQKSLDPFGLMDSDNFAQLEAMLQSGEAAGSPTAIES